MAFSKMIGFHWFSFNSVLLLLTDKLWESSNMNCFVIIVVSCFVLFFFKKRKPLLKKKTRFPLATIWIINGKQGALQRKFKHLRKVWILKFSKSVQKPVVLGCTNDFNWFIKQFPGFSKQIVVYDVSIVYPCL